MTATPPAPHGRDLFAGLGAVDPETLAGLAARLAAEAAAAGILDVAYRTVSSPLGELLVATTVQGLVRIAFESQGHDRVLEELAGRVSPRLLRAPARLDEVARELDEYFARRRTAFDLPVDLRLAAGFRHQVLVRLQEVAYGTTASYGALAAAAGRPGAARAVGSACATNPVPIVVPCHRVVRSDGSPGQYGGGAAAKVMLLRLEAA